jgi:hypothetical protein
MRVQMLSRPGKFARRQKIQRNFETPRPVLGIDLKTVTTPPVANGPRTALTPGSREPFRIDFIKYSDYSRAYG